MIIYAISDTHGKLDFDIPECDLLLHAGDIAPWYGGWTLNDQLDWFDTKFVEWAKSVPAKHVVLIPGNHDFVCEQGLIAVNENLPDNCHIIHDKLIEIEGLKVFGTSWQPRFCNWAFNCSDTKDDLYRRYKAIPEAVDVLLTHCPPKGACDVVQDGFNATGANLGSSSLMLRLYELQPKPLVNICGHIHSAYGQSNIGETKIYNVSVVNEKYEIIRGATKIEI